MARIARFEDIEGWQRARTLASEVFDVVKAEPFARDFALRDQICRAVVSAMANIAEGFERDGNAEFLQFLSIAKGSAAEVQSHLYVALDRHYISQVQFNALYAEADRIKQLIGGLCRYLRGSGLKGRKYASNHTPNQER